MIDYRSEIAKLVILALADLAVTVEPGVLQVTEPPDPRLGDFSLPCFPLAQVMHTAPGSVAQQLAQRLQGSSLFPGVKAKGPYLNFFVDRGQLLRQILSQVRASGSKYGSSGFGTGQRAIVEHTSTNPNASPHVGRARNALIGDCLVRLLRFEDYQVEAHFFVNDVGKQIGMLVLGANGRSVTFDELLDLYVEENRRVEADPAVERQVFDLLARLEQGDQEVRRRFRQVVDTCVAGQKAILGRIDIEFDAFDYESDYLWSGRTGEILEELQTTGRLFEDDDKRLVLNLEGYQLPARSPVLVLTRGDKTSLYALRDIAYTLDKMASGADRNIIVLGEDQQLYFLQVAAALDVLGKPAPEVVHYSWVVLQEGRMSTRQGQVVLLEDFLQQAINKASAEISKRGGPADDQHATAIATGAIKYAILKTSNEKNVVFDWDTALSFEGESGPYLQYSHARICSILRKFGRAVPASADAALLVEDAEVDLVKELGRFPSTIQRGLSSSSPHILANYLFGVAKRFSTFYHACPVLSAPGPLRDARLQVADATRQVTRNGLLLLGIPAIEEM